MRLFAVEHKIYGDLRFYCDRFAGQQGGLAFPLLDGGSCCLRQQRVARKHLKALDRASLEISACIMTFERVSYEPR
jgi:hypothetical protein